MKFIHSRPVDQIRIWIDITRISFILSLCLAGYLVYMTLQETPQVTLNFDSLTSVKGIKQTILEAPQARDFDLYVPIINQRDIFKSPYSTSSANNIQVSTSGTIDGKPITNMQNNFKLVGIVLDKNSKAIIENIKTQETLFFTVGEEINGVVLEELGEGKAVFSLNNERFELTP